MKEEMHVVSPPSQDSADSVAIVCCSNGQRRSTSSRIVEHLCRELWNLGLRPVLSPCIYAEDGGSAAPAMERARALMNFYRDSSIKAIYDISGGDMANEILPYLDFDFIANSGKQLWGYSDLTTILNAIYTKTGRTSVLYQVRNLIYEDGETQRRNFKQAFFGKDHSLFDISYEFCQGRQMQGTVVGGNIRCLLKLAGTEYFPDTEGKILLLEGYHGTVPQVTTYLSQLKQMGVLDKAAGILLGTFTQMEQEQCRPDVVSLVKQFVNQELPIAKTREIGHGADSKGIIIGNSMLLESIS